MEQWYYSLGGQQLGPHTSAELQGLLAQGRIQPTTPVWQQGMAGWIPLQQAVPHLVPVMTAPAKAKKKGGCLKAVVILAILAVILVVGLLILGVAAIPVFNGLRHTGALERRAAEAARLQISADMIPAEVQRYKLFSSNALRSVDGAEASGKTGAELVGTYSPPYSTEVTDDVLGTYHDKYSVYVAKFESPEAAARDAASHSRAVKEDGGYFTPDQPEYGVGHTANCYFRWSKGPYRFQVTTHKQNEPQLRAFVAAYQTAANAAP